MSDERDPDYDQQAPVDVEGAESVHDSATKSFLAMLNDPRMPNGVMAAITECSIIMNQRKEHGLAKYGVVLHKDNGRDSFRDLIEELSDAVAYSIVLQQQGKVGNRLVGMVMGVMIAAVYSRDNDETEIG